MALPRRSADEDSEDPSPEDLERFGHEHAYCPDCGEEVWEDAQYCSACGSYFSTASVHPPVKMATRRMWQFAVLVLALAGMLLFTVCSGRS